MTNYNPKFPLIVTADASEAGIGAVVLHKFSDGNQKAIAYVSRCLNKAEESYSQIKNEGLALKKFHKLLYERKFTLYTDHTPLLSIFGNKKGIPVHTANRLQRWTTMCLCYDFDQHHEITNKFGHTDALSRLIAESFFQTDTADTIIAMVEADVEVEQTFGETMKELPVTAEMISNVTEKRTLAPTSEKIRTKGLAA